MPKRIGKNSGLFGVSNKTKGPSTIMKSVMRAANKRLKDFPKIRK